MILQRPFKTGKTKVQTWRCSSAGVSLLHRNVNTGAPYIPPPAKPHPRSKSVFISSHVGPSEALQGWLCTFSSSERKRETDRMKERKGESTEVCVTPSHTIPILFLYFSTSKHHSTPTTLASCSLRTLSSVAYFLQKTQLVCDPRDHFLGDMMLRRMRCLLEVTVPEKQAEVGVCMSRCMTVNSPCM